MIGSSPRLLSFQAGESPLHNLDARTKLLAMVGIIAGVLIAATPITIGIAYVLGVLGGLLAYKLLPALWRALRPLLVLIVLFGFIIVVITPGHALMHIWILVPTRDGVALAIRLGFQALLIVYTTSLMTLTTPPLSIAGAMEWALGSLERVKVPVRDIIAMVAIGLTFVPLLIEETQKVISAQRARGADLGMNALLDEESMGALLIPLLLANLRRGSELAESMEARLYNTGPRTSMVERHFHRPDAIAGLLVVAGLLAIVGISFL